MNVRYTLTIIAATLALASCGGGSSSSPKTQSTVSSQTTSGSLEGIYDGVTNTGSQTTSIIRSNGELWVIYSSRTDSSKIEGFVYGKSTSSNGQFSAPNLTDFNFDGAGVLKGSATATYTNFQTVSGTITYPAAKEVVGLTGTFDPSYNQQAKISNIAGTYDAYAFNELADEGAALIISDSGAVTGVGQSGCKFSGSVTPDTSGNVFTFAITFGDAPCLYAKQNFRGAAIYDATEKLIGTMSVNSALDSGIMLIGKKQ